MRSGSSTDLPRLEPGTEVAGFRLERELGRGRHAIVYEATQVSLDRRVALKLLPEGSGSLPASLEWPEHPHVVGLYAAGSWTGGQFVAMRLVQGTSLDRLARAGDLDPAGALELLDDVASALDAAHDTGVVHGAVAARNVLVDDGGQALLSDFGLAGGDPNVVADRRAFAALLRELLGGRVSALPDPGAHSASELVRAARADMPVLSRPATRTRARQRVRVAIAAAVGVAAVVGATVVLSGRESEIPERVPSLAPGAVALGSVLEPGRVSSVDCSGQPPSGGSQECTLVQTSLAGRRIVASKAGTIRRWAVRGAQGELALQVVRRVGNRYVASARTPYERIPDTGVHVLPANLPVGAGDHVGVQLTPGAAIGVRQEVAGAKTARWLGQLSRTARPIELGVGTGFDHEILLWAEYAPGAKPSLAGELRGLAAARAPAGVELSARYVDLPGGLARVAVVKLADEIAVDLFAGPRRTARVPAPEADPGGRLLFFTATRGSPNLRWRNPDGRTVLHAYTIRGRTLIFRG